MKSKVTNGLDNHQVLKGRLKYHMNGISINNNPLNPNPFTCTNPQEILPFRLISDIDHLFSW
jgi:hypothetical protein